MKKILLLLAVIFVTSVSNAQERLSFNKVIQVDSTLTKLDIYNGIKEWFGMNFVSAKNVIEIDDKDAGLIIGNSITDFRKKGLVYICYNGSLKFTIKVQIRDSRFRVEITNFLHSVNPGNDDGCALGLITTIGSGKTGAQKSFADKVWADIIAQSELLSNEFFVKFENIEFKPQLDDANDDW